MLIESLGRLIIPLLRGVPAGRGVFFLRGVPAGRGVFFLKGVPGGRGVFFYPLFNSC
jgi:hypothetical protein